jgi:hypothetical protein
VRRFGAGLPHADLWVVLRGNCMVVNGYRGTLPCGIGITRRNNLLFHQLPVAGVWGALVIYDGSSFEQLAERPLRIPGQSCAVDDILTGDPLLNAIGATPVKSCPPAVGLDGAWMIDRWAESTPEARAALARLYPPLVVQAVPPTLRGLKLIE